jgi:hypothetical protein
MKRRWVISLVLVAFCMGVLSGRFWFTWELHQWNGLDYGYNEEWSAYTLMPQAGCYATHCLSTVRITCDDESKMPPKYWLGPGWLAKMKKMGLKEPAPADPVAKITQLVNDGVKADLAGDASFVEKNYYSDYYNYENNFTSGSSWGNWETMQSILADMRGGKIKTNMEQISGLKVRIYGCCWAVVTYKSTYDRVYKGEHQFRTNLTTDTFYRHDFSWKWVARHSSQAAE